MNLFEAYGEQVGLAVRNAIATERADRLKIQFFHNIAFDFRSCIGPIVGATSLLLADSAEELTAEQRELIEIANRSSKELTRLLNDFMDLVRIEGAPFPDIQPINMWDCIHEVLPQLRHQIDAKHQVVTVDVLPTLNIMADRLRLQQTIVNLLSNAVEYSPNKGAIDIRARTDGKFAIVTIADNGAGIDQAKLTLISELFSAPFRKRIPPQFRGLGLPIANAYIKTMNGQIGVTSEPGKGSTFWFTLPVAEEGSSTDS